MVACGGDSGSADAMMVDLGDGGSSADAAPGVCNPVSQMGCDADEKCAQVVENIDPFLARTACVPAGPKKAGQMCESGEPGPMGYDDCEAGLACNGVCVGICSVGPPEQKQNCQTPKDESCVLFQNTFDDVGNMDVGLCAPACDPVTQTRLKDGVPSEDMCPALGERVPACYLSAVLGTTSCSGVPDAMPGNGTYEPLELKQDDECYGPNEMQCFLNGCAAGYGPVLNNPEGGAKSWCTAWCRPIPTFQGAGVDYDLFADWDVGAGTDDEQEELARKGDLANGLGCSTNKTSPVGGSEAPSTIHDCRFVSRFYGNTTSTPDAFGFCLPLNTATEFGNCEDWDFDAWLRAQAQQKPDMSMNPEFDEFYCTNGDQSMDAMVDYVRCPRGCVGVDALEAIYEDFPFMSATGKREKVTPAKGFMDPKLLENLEKISIQQAEVEGL